MWFRQDLRLTDNPALLHAADSGKPILPLFILDEHSPDVRPLGAAQKWWLHHSLLSLSNGLKKLGCTLVLRRGASEDIIRNLVQDTSADAICWNRRYGAGEQPVDAAVRMAGNTRAANAATGIHSRAASTRGEKDTLPRRI